jgi:hypothetical protein
MSHRSVPVQESTLIGKWQQIGKPAVILTFLKNGTFRADVSGQTLLSGSYHLAGGDQMVLERDGASATGQSLTNSVSMTGNELWIIPANGKRERYKHAE